jgi:hypothetical protein
MQFETTMKETIASREVVKRLRRRLTKRLIRSRLLPHRDDRTIIRHVVGEREQLRDLASRSAEGGKEDKKAETYSRLPASTRQIWIHLNLDFQQTCSRNNLAWSTAAVYQ